MATACRNKTILTRQAAQIQCAPRNYWRDNMSQSAFLSTCLCSVPASRSQTTGLASHLVIGSPTSSFSLSFSVSPTGLLSFSVLCFTLFFPTSSVLLSSQHHVQLSIDNTHTHTIPIPLRVLCLPWPLTVHWHPPVSQWETLTVKEEITSEGKRVFYSVFLSSDHLNRWSADVVTMRHQTTTRTKKTYGHAHTPTHMIRQTSPSLCPWNTCFNKHAVIFSSDACDDSAAVSHGCLDDLLIQRLRLFKICMIALLTNKHNIWIRQ